MTRDPLDLRLAPAALAAWLATGVAVGWGVRRSVVGALVLLVAAAVTGGGGWRRPQRPSGIVHRPPRLARPVLATAIVAAAGGLAAGGLQAGAVQAGPVPGLAAERAQVDVVAEIASDPVPREGRFGDYVLVRLRVEEVTGRGHHTRVRTPVLLIGPPAWLRVDLGDTVEVAGRLQVAAGVDLAGVLVTQQPPTVTASAGPVARSVAAVRDGISEAASPLPPGERALVPALVAGDDTSMPDDVSAQFRETGLTHLLAVSGTNLTLVLGFVLFAARWCGVRGHGRIVVGLGAVVFFVLLARPEPSVLRAAAMGVVALAGMSAGGRRRGVRALCLSVLCLVLVDPWLARSVGFALSVLATAGILVLAPWWRDALGRWLPRPVAEAVAVPLAAQLACTPVIAAISGQVSLVAVAANLLVAPAVGPTTILGLAAGLVSLVDERAGHLGGQMAGLGARWIVWVAEQGAELDGASAAWPTGPPGIAALTVLCLVAVAVMPLVLRRRWLCLGVTTGLCLAIVQPGGRPGWPPDDWAMVMCDVGQGDGLVLNAGPGTAVVVDTGPDPEAIDGCLDDLGVRRIPLVVLTHFHADHVDGLPGVLAGRRVGEIEVSPLPEPAGGAAAVRRWASAAGVPVTVAERGERRRVGDLRWRVLGPVDRAPPQVDSGEEGSAPNNASVMLLARAQGLRILLTGDAEPQEQSDVLEVTARPAVDVLKVPHHGSANQDTDFVRATGAAVAVISVGADNDYGHPATHTLGLLGQLGARVYRTDEDGDIALVPRGDRLLVLTSRR